MITELVNLKTLESTTDEELISSAESLINGFWKKQEGFIDAEMVKAAEDNTWTFVYHFDNMESVKAGGENMRNSKEFGDFLSVIDSKSIRVNFFQSIKKWQ